MGDNFKEYTTEALKNEIIALTKRLEVLEKWREAFLKPRLFVGEVPEGWTSFESWGK